MANEFFNSINQVTTVKNNVFMWDDMKNLAATIVEKQNAPTSVVKALPMAKPIITAATKLMPVEIRFNLKLLLDVTQWLKGIISANELCLCMLHMY